MMTTANKITSNMRRGLSLSALGLSLFLTPNFLGPEGLNAQAAGIVRLKDDGAASVQNISLGLNKSMVIDLPRDAHDLLVASPSLADAVIRSKRRIYIFGKSVGETNIFVFDATGNPIVSMNLNIERDVSTLSSRLKRFIPGSDIKVELINDNVVLTGSVQTPQDSARAERLAKAFVTGGEATTGAFTQSANATSADGSQSSTSIIDPSLRSSSIINMLEIEADDQVTLKVVIAEVQRSVMKQLGVTSQFSSNSGSIGFTTFNGEGFGIGNAQGPFASAIGGALGNNTLSASIRAFERAGVARTLAEPSLTAVSGKPASFSVGGTYYIGGGKTRDEQDREVSLYVGEQYSIGLDFTPTVLSPGRIEIDMKTNVSEPDVQGSATGGDGGTFGGMRTRSASTTVELPSGGSLVVAGLVQDNIRQAITKLPGLGNLPVLGSLFRSRDFQHDETELVIIVTPYLVRPVAQHQLQRPDDNFQVNDDVTAALLGRISKIYGQETAPKARYNGNVGFIIQ